MSCECLGQGISDHYEPAMLPKITADKPCFLNGINSFDIAINQYNVDKLFLNFNKQMSKHDVWKTK